MAVSPRFASGKYSWGICDVCGIRAKLRTLRVETKMGRPVNIMACETDWDPDHPQNFLPKFIQNDPQALRNPRPDTGLEQSRLLAPAGNWVNGQKPTDEQLAERALAVKLQHERERALWAFQEGQQRLRQRSFST